MIRLLVFLLLLLKRCDKDLATAHFSGLKRAFTVINSLCCKGRWGLVVNIRRCLSLSLPLSLLSLSLFLFLSFPLSLYLQGRTTATSYQKAPLQREALSSTAQQQLFSSMGLGVSLFPPGNPFSNSYTMASQWEGGLSFCIPPCFCSCRGWVNKKSASL